ncbi:hypothetical protein [Photobacterium phosphoreum]|nr:hypothetical protein [Photobacterium phosphoreum]
MSGFTGKAILPHHIHARPDGQAALGAESLLHSPTIIGRAIRA